MQSVRINPGKVVSDHSGSKATSSECVLQCLAKVRSGTCRLLSSSSSEGHKSKAGEVNKPKNERQSHFVNTGQAVIKC